MDRTLHGVTNGEESAKQLESLANVCTGRSDGEWLTLAELQKKIAV